MLVEAIKMVQMGFDTILCACFPSLVISTRTNHDTHLNRIYIKDMSGNYIVPSDCHTVYK